MNVSQNKGYTLVELIIVIVILGILSAAILPNVSLMSSFKTNFYQRQLIQAMRGAQRLAIATECNVVVKILSTGYEVDLPALANNCKIVPSTSNIDKFTINPDLNGLEKNTLANPSDTQLCNSNTSCTLYFNSMGQCLDNTGTVLSTSTPIIQINNGELKIQVVGETGYVYAT